jgi:alcohol dehydrogenase
MSGRLIMGIGALEELPGALERLGTGKALVVTDQGLVKAGICARVEEALTDAKVDHAVFDGVEPDPRIEIVYQCRDAAQDSGCDTMIGLGGGSSLDIAKVGAVLLTNGGDVEELIGIDMIPQAGISTVLIPTTAGTGSEVTPIAVLSDHAAHIKRGVVSEHLYADVSIIDPALVASLPPYITAFTGIDALTHAIEAYTNKYAQPFVDGFATAAIEVIGGNLRRAVACGDDLEARYSMSLGSLYGGMCLGPVNTAAVHAMAYPLGGMFNVPHGVANSLLLPYVTRYNLISNLEKYANVAFLLGENIEGLSVRDAAESAVDAVVQLSADVGIVSRMRDLDIPEDAIDDMAEACMKVTRLMDNNPRRMTLDAARQIYREAY